MNVNNIHFFSEETDFKLKHKMRLRTWIIKTIQTEGFLKLKELNFIFCSDDYLLNINQEYLDHDTYTDIITFDNSEEEKTLSGDIYISIDRVKENSATYRVDVNDELQRIIIHGILHLCGYADKTKADKNKMTEKEDFYLARR